MNKRIGFEKLENVLFLRESPNNNSNQDLRLRLLRSVLNDSLTKTQKCYIMLYYKENMKIADIASLFGVAPSTVSRTVNRARKNLYRAITGRELFSRFADQERGVHTS